MVNFSELFNVNATTLPMDKKSLSSMMNRATLVGYYQCAYSSLISTLKMIQSAPELSVSLNPQWLWNNANNPTNKLECIIQIEGMQTYSEFVDKVVKNDDSNEWTDFLTYSPEFRDEIKDLKTRAFKKFLWNYDNINNWINYNNVGVIKSGKNPYDSSKEITKEADNEIANKYINLLSETITQCVIATNQTYVESLKKSGSFDAEAQKEAFRRTYESVMNILTVEAKQYLANIYGDLDKYITSKIESEVNINK